MLAVAGVVGAAHAEQLDQAHAVGLFLRASGLSRVGFYVTAPEEASFLTHHRHSCGGRLAMYNKFIGGMSESKANRVKNEHRGPAPAHRSVDIER